MLYEFHLRTEASIAEGKKCQAVHRDMVNERIILKRFYKFKHDGESLLEVLKVDWPDV